MMDATKYAPGYYPVPAGYDSWVKKDHIEKAPAWCSVDLRDGNQALIVPMSLAEKLEFFQMLVKIGFKEIEVGFPAASETEYEFLRTLIEKDMIPADVTVQVLTQCRDHIIRRTFEAVKGAPRAVIHFYNSTSVAQREQVFHKSKEEIKKIATDGARLVKQLSQEYEGNFLFEYSPESFTGTEVDYAVEVCNAVLDIMEPTPDRPMIINIGGQGATLATAYGLDPSIADKCIVYYTDIRVYNGHYEWASRIIAANFRVLSWGDDNWWIVKRCQNEWNVLPRPDHCRASENNPMSGEWRLLTEMHNPMLDHMVHQFRMRGEYSNDGRCSDAYADGTFIHAWLPGIFTDAELREVRGAEVLHITSFTEQDEAEVKALTMDTLLDPRAYRFRK